jgi:hypothetical protein
MSGKKLTSQARTGQSGVNLIEQLVLKMGCAWHSLNPSLDVGIDGEIELVNRATNEATGLVIRVQSKATVAAFPSENAHTFDWPCSERDIEYWVAGNTPVILVVSRPHLSEAYWVSIKDYFGSPARRKSKRIRFKKAESKFDADAYARLFALAAPRDRGLYFAPPPREETVFSSLLSVEKLPDRLWIGDTDLRSAPDVYAKLREAGVKANEFVLDNRRILSVHDLTQPPWSAIVDRGTVDDFDTSEWSQTTDQDRLRVFVHLLNKCLSSRVFAIGCDRRRDTGLYYYAATEDLKPLVMQYQSVQEKTERSVFLPYFYTKGKRQGEVKYYRHSGFYGQFRRYESKWYVDISPSYFFSSDGKYQHPLAEEYQKGIKRLEKNATVLGQIVMWSALLRGRGEEEEARWYPNPYTHLHFGPLAKFATGVGIDEKLWLESEEEVLAKSVTETVDDLPLFSPNDSPYAEEGSDEEELAS